MRSRIDVHLLYSAAMQGASVEESAKPFEARTRPLSASQPPLQLTEQEVDRLVALASQRSRVSLSPGAEVPGTRYRIDGWLGDGGTGVVFQATHQDLGRKVAIKVLHSQHSDDPQLLQTFREEARVATKIGSPYIVEVIDFAELPDGRLLYVMERLRGVSLDREVKHAPMPMERLIPILRQACKGLAAAHDVGLVHRDIKPEHLLVLDPHEPAANGRRDRIKIMDFGISSVVGGAAGGMQGTPSYMAPEQVMGVGVARQNDVYSLGCSAYELLVGEPPFRRGNLGELLRAHLKDTPAPPNERLGRDAVHPSLEAVVMKCLAKYRKNRYQDMRELEVALIEAQLAAGIETPWDDLPLPAVDPARVAELEAGFAALRSKSATARPRYEWWLPALLGTLIAGAAALGGHYLWREPAQQPAIAAVDARVEHVVLEAKNAAAKALYYYPPANDPDAATAYTKVLELESFAQTQERLLGLERARDLRQEFADTLERLGDQFWDRPHGRGFAHDYYQQALLFDPGRTRLRDLAGGTFGEQEELVRKAQQQDFSQAELQAGNMLTVFALEDKAAREEGIRKMGRELRSGSSSSLVRATRFEELARQEGVLLDPEPPQPELPSIENLRLALAEALQPAVAEVEDEPADPSHSKARDPRKARKMASQGSDALRAGRWDDASLLFHAALMQDRKCSTALIGLSDLHFEKAEHSNAVRYAKMAVAAAPRRPDYRIKYGDALVKVVEYAAAREQYEMAAKLGSRVARNRLQRLEEKTGG